MIVAFSLKVVAPSLEAESQHASAVLPYQEANYRLPKPLCDSSE